MVPLFRGLGYSIIVVCCVSEMYYAVICGWSFFYMFAGMQSPLPWINCNDGEEWHTPDCYTREIAQQCRQDKFDNHSTDLAYIWYNASCVAMEMYCKAHGYDGGEDSEPKTNVTNVYFICHNITDDNTTSTTGL